MRSVTVAACLTAGEVGSALGLAVDGPEPAGRSVCFRARDSRRMVLVVAGYAGAAARRLVRLLPGTALPGVGDEGRLRDNGGWVRVGDAVVLVTLVNEGRASAPGVPRLLTRVAVRLGVDR